MPSPSERSPQRGVVQPPERKPPRRTARKPARKLPRTGGPRRWTAVALRLLPVVPAAMILLELAQIYEEKINQPADGFALRQQA